MLKRAAELQGRTMTDFVVAAVQEAAQRAIEQAGIVRCSLADLECFAQALLAPPQPNLALECARLPPSQDSSVFWMSTAPFLATRLDGVSSEFGQNRKLSQRRGVGSGRGRRRKRRFKHGKEILILKKQPVICSTF